jgi:RimJ/RimL family protein N-acetyltransferase
MQIKEVFSPPEIISVQGLADEIWHEYYPAIITHEQITYMLDTFQTARAILQQIQEGYQYFLLKDETNLGYMAIKRHQDRIFLSKLYIQKASRQKGYAKEAIRFLKDLADKEGLRSIDLTVNIHNTTAITAYDRIGFHKTGNLVQDIGNGFIMDDFTFELLCEKSTTKAR